MPTEQELIRLGYDISISIMEEIVKVPPVKRGKLITIKSNKDTTTYIDQRAEQSAFQLFSERADTLGVTFHVLSEEQNGKVQTFGAGKDNIWVVLDPVDGSLNACTNIPFYGCNIAFTEPTDKTGEELTLGDFTLGMTMNLVDGGFYFVRDGKANFRFPPFKYPLGDLTTLISKKTDPKESLVMIDAFNAHNRRSAEYSVLPLRLGFKTYGTLRSTGLELMALIAHEGQVPGYDAYVGVNQKVDNIIAALPILRSLGATITDEQGKPLDGYSMYSRPTVVIGSTPQLHASVLEMLKEE